MIYFDNAATTKKKPKEVIDAVCYALENFGNSSRGVYDESLSADRVVYDTRKKIAKMFGVSNFCNVVFTKNSTESLNISINGLLTDKDHVITSVTEHNSVLRPLNYLKEKGLEVDYIGIDEKGVLKISEIEKFIKKNTKAIILNHASNVTGNINDIEKVSKICKKHNLIFIVDASQTAGAFEIDMDKMNIDVLCFTAHKSLYAPQGLGLLCVKENVYIKPFIVGGTGMHSFDPFQPDKMPTRLEAGTLNSHAIAGLNASIDYILKHKMKNLTKKANDIAKYFYENIKDIEGVKIYGDFLQESRCPIVSINLKDTDSAVVSKILSFDYGISTRSGIHCAPLIHKAFSTLNQGMVRFSFSYTNTYDEVNVAINAIKNILNE